MNLSTVLACVAVFATAVHAGNPASLRSTDSNSEDDGSKQFDFSDVDQTSTNLSSSGSDSEACPEKCTMETNPTFDRNNVLYLNECMLRLAECSGNPHLSAAYFVEDILLMSGLNGTVYLSPQSGSGSQEKIVVDYGIEELLGGGKSSTKSILDGNEGANGPPVLELKSFTNNGDA